MVNKDEYIMCDGNNNIIIIIVNVVS